MGVANILLFGEYLLNACFVPGIVLDPGSMEKNGLECSMSRLAQETGVNQLTNSKQVRNPEEARTQCNGNKEVLVNSAWLGCVADERRTRIEVLQRR